MNLSSYSESLKGSVVPNVSIYLKALWYDAKNDWTSAHNLIDEMEDKDACWLHAYLHRKEGDVNNANYWYSKAGKKRPGVTLDAEWKELVNYFLVIN